MPIAKWGTPSARSGNLAGTLLNGLAVGAESAAISFNNSGSSNQFINAVITVKLGSITASSTASITLTVIGSDGVDFEDSASGDRYLGAVSSGTSAKVVMFKMVRLYAFPLRFTITNNTGATFPTGSPSGNEFYVTVYPEEIS